MPPMSTIDLLLVHQVDHRMRAVRIELRGVGAGQPALVAGELDHRAVQAEAQTEIRDVAASRAYAGGRDLALDAADAEPAGHDDAVEIVQAALGEQAFGVVGGDPVDLDLGAAARSRRASAPRPPTGTRREG